MLSLTDRATAALTGLPEEALAAYLEARMEREADPPFCRLVRGEDALTLDALDGTALRAMVEARLTGAEGAATDTVAVAPALLRDGDPLSVALPKTRPTAPAPDAPAEIALIDAGIAFWNPGFLELEICSVGHLAPSGFGGIQQLTRAEIDTAVARGGTQEGDRTNRLMLAAAFPGSVHSNPPGRAPLVRPGRPAHGTAMLDAIGRKAPQGARVHALELPRAVLRDSTGIRMRTVLPLALAAVAGMAARAAGPTAPLRLVVLLAYGFPGGPQRGADPGFLRAVSEVIEALAARNIALELVLPTGNHLQGRGVAHLPAPAPGAARPPLTWRTLPGDHSNNRLELFHDPGAPELTLTAPDGARLTRGEGETFALIRSDDHVVGLVYTQPASDTIWRTEVILSGSAARRDRPGAPFGAWTLGLGGEGEARAYVRRDDSGYMDDRAAPFRPSWLEDPAYRARDARGLPGADDADHPDSLVRRAGTVSVLCTGEDARLHPVGARWEGGGESGPSIYAGLAASPGTTPETEAVDGPGPFIGMPLRGDGSTRLFRLSGTSVAAALRTGAKAAGQIPTSASP
ncbi:hypothetical protein [Jannaschia formosa]|uniref:hypothetical protein n=1 Tax=Jannaschia formosa TaxID=2259592 RepID=UPI000E1C04D7|nr:hypothetical protein [Jannaschia formosa]TFL19347.1 hypothetical protein DR046_05325 [Jannaschia formosa]